MSKITERMKRELERLALLRDDEINTVDLPEHENWTNGDRSRFFQSQIQERGYDIRSIANWFISRLNESGSRVTNLSLNKILYFAVERFLVEKGTLITRAKIEAWAHGPVFREVYHALKDFGDKPIDKQIKKFSVSERKFVTAADIISASDEAFLEEILRTYGRLSASQLVDLSHRDNEPWASVWHYQGSARPGMEISTETILQKAPKRRQFDVR